jgi:hypothetical protein
MSTQNPDSATYRKQSQQVFALERKLSSGAFPLDVHGEGNVFFFLPSITVQCTHKGKST